MILIDTSIWIHLLKKNKDRVTFEQLLSAVICPPVLQEVLQGIREDIVHYKMKESLLALTRVGDPLLTEDYFQASEIYRMGKRKGFTIRSSTDCLIATIAIKNKIPIWHNDRDFDAISKFTDLRIRSL